MSKHCYDYPMFSVAVDLVVVGCDDKGAAHVLLVRRGKDPFQGLWALPGGFLNQDETGPQAARRECREETGVDPGDTAVLVGVYDAVGRDPRGRVIGLAHKITLPDMPFALGADDAAEARWFPVSGLPDALSFDHAEILEEALWV